MSALPQKPRVLVVEDEEDIRDLISLHLSRNGYEVEAVADGEAAQQKIQESPGRFQLFILDWMLPGVNGVDLTRAIRGSKGPDRQAPILMVTARAEGADVVLGLEAGADDYVTKPFEIPVLLARVRALLRRREIPEGASGEESVVRIGGLKIDEAAHEVFCGTGKVDLTPSEFKLLVALARNRGRVLTRERLIDLVQGEGVTVVDRAIDTHVFGLRKKLADCADVVETVRGVGYRVRAAD